MLLGADKRARTTLGGGFVAAALIYSKCPTNKQTNTQKNASLNLILLLKPNIVFKSSGLEEAWNSGGERETTWEDVSSARGRTPRFPPGGFFGGRGQIMEGGDE